MKKKQLVKRALENPELYSEAELAYFQMWIQEKEEKKRRKKLRRRLELEELFLS